MGAEYYLFALFVFGLVALLIALFLRGMKQNRKQEEEGIDEKEKKVMMLYFEVEDMIEAFKQYVETSRESMENNLRRIETDMHALGALREGLGFISEERERISRERAEEQPPIDITVGEGDELPPAEEEAAAEEEPEDVEAAARRRGVSKTEIELMRKFGQYDDAKK